MRGKDLTQDQLDRAKEFVKFCQVFKRELADEQDVVLRFGDLVRLVAWYGAIRFVASQNGIGTLDCPAQTGTVHQ